MLVFSACALSMNVFLQYGSKRIKVQKLWSSSDGEVIEPPTKKEFHPLLIPSHLVKGQWNFLRSPIDFFSNPEFSVTFISRDDTAES